MSLSRWKMMAGVLGVSIGGLAAAASQCPKWDKSKGRTPEEPVAKVDTKLPPAGPPSAPDLPPLPSGPSVPTAPQLVPAGSSPTPAPSALPPIPDFVPDAKPVKADVTPAAGTLPPIPAGPSAPAVKPADPPRPATPPVPAAPIDLTPVKPATPPPAPTTGDLIPLPPAAPLVKPTPPATPPMPAPTAGPDGRGLTGTPQFTGPAGEPLPLNPTPTKPPAAPAAPAYTPPVSGASGFQPPAGPATPPLPTPAAPTVNEGNLDIPPSKPAVAPPAAAPATVADAVKFRIVLRVGEGEPMFEVKNGDNLVLKVACDKVDIKSPEKGTGLSEVTARGKVRFVGFGAEGTCDELKFLAGTGEVQMTGDVKVQVKDKLGRVESELSAGTLKYKIDASATSGALKP